MKLFYSVGAPIVVRIYVIVKGWRLSPAFLCMLFITVKTREKGIKNGASLCILEKNRYIRQ